MDERSKAEEQLDRIRRNADGPEAARKLYDEWAQGYDADLTGMHGYVAPQATAHALAELMPDRSAPILDVGCGTGLVGQALADSGCSCIDGIDISAEMLAEAGKKGVYRALWSENLLEGTSADADSYAAVIGVGVFSRQLLPPPVFDELIRLVRPGGHFALVVRGDQFESEGFAAKMRDLSAAGHWQVLAHENVPYLDTLGERGDLILSTACD
ncbi:class I SAM-dependent DNA methyltransferase [Algihabitans albus]|uniref:class I SAM-dependent DNA methyltransferase n=1 Tax=Algihabitans albus TaxID=2164067 RepID=UPI0013C32899|nr:class I SAM-dependent methyltransferase [Algihabitans albus]